MVAPIADSAARRVRDRGAGLDDAYLPIRTLATYSGLSVRTLRGYLVHPSRPLPHYRIGGKILVRRSDFDPWAAAFRAVEPERISRLVGEVVEELV